MGRRARLVLFLTLAAIALGCSGDKDPTQPDAAGLPDAAAAFDAGLSPDTGPDEPDASIPDAGCDFPCGEECCSEDQICDEGHCRTCSPESDQDLCLAAGRECGPLLARDDCGVDRQIDECGPCPDPQVCLSDGTCCHPASDSAICDREEAECGPLVADDGCGGTRVIEDCGACPSGLACGTDHTCGDNDTCDHPAFLALDAQGQASVQVDTLTATDSSSSLCDPEGGRDRVYAFHLEEPRDVLVRVSPLDSVYKAVVSVRATCDLVETERGCARNMGNGPAEVRIPRLAAGTWYVWVDGLGTVTNGLALLEVQATAPGDEIPNDTCDTAQALSLASGSAQVLDTTAGAAHDVSGSCEPMPGGDRLYAFELETDSALWASVSRVASESPLFEPALHLRSDCQEPSSEAACGAHSKGSAFLSVPALPAGVWYLAVDGANAPQADGTSITAGAFALEVRTGPARLHDTCAGAFPVLIDPQTRTGLVEDDTSFALDSGSPSCTPKEIVGGKEKTGRDLVFSFEVPPGASQDATIRVQPAPGSALKPVVALQATCADRDSEVTCQAQIAAKAALLSASRLEPGTWYVWVDSSEAASHGAFTLTITLSDPEPPPPHDACLLARPLVLDALGQASETGSTLAALNDGAGGCAGAEGHSGGDVVYAFTLESPANVAFNVYRLPSTPGFRPALYLRSGCDSQDAEVACGNELNGVAKLTSAPLPAGTWYLHVDGLAGTRGDFLLDVIVYGPPSNDDCQNVATLAFDDQGVARAIGDTCAATNSGLSLNCLGSGKDVVYAFTLPSEKNVRVALRPGHGDTSVLSLRSDCLANSYERICQAQKGGTNAFELKRLPQGTWYVWVDSYGQCGAFALEVTAVDPPAEPENGSCDKALALTFDQGVAEAQGDTRLAYDSGRASCAAAEGSDLYYSFELTAPQRVAVRATPTSGSALAPAVSLHASCGAQALEAACAAASAGSAASLVVPRLPAGFWIVRVDAAQAGQEGAFFLEVEIDDPEQPQPANDACAQALELTFDAQGRATWSGETSAATDDARGGCALPTAPFSGPDLFFRFTLDAPASVTATLRRDPSTPAYRPALTLRTRCEGEEGACAFDEAGVAQVTATLPKGQHLVVVDGAAQTFGAFTLELTRTDATVQGESCFNPRPLELEGGHATLPIDLGGAADNARGSCGGQGRDAVFSFTLTEPKSLVVSLSSQAPSALAPVLHLRRDRCGDLAAEQGCSAAAAEEVASLAFHRLPPGVWYLWVDSGADSGTALLSATLGPAEPQPANDSCAAAELIKLTSLPQTQTVSATTKGASDDARGWCGGEGGALAGPDVVYAIWLEQRARVFAVVRPATPESDFAPALYLRRACDSGARDDELGCGLALDGTATLEVPDLPAGTWYLIVDGAAYSAGAFDLTVMATEPGAGDSCSSAELLTLDEQGVAEVLGSNARAARDAAGTCGNDSGREVVYAFTVTSPKNVIVDVTPLGGLQPVVYLRWACDQPSTEMGCQSRSAPEPVRLTANKLWAGTWFLFVDSRNLDSAGAFALRVEAKDPEGPPVNDACAGALPIVLDRETNKGTATGDTTDATNDYTGSCSTQTNPMNGADLAYFFTLEADAKVTVEVKRDPATPLLKPAVMIRRTCDSGAPADEAACRISATTDTVTAGPLGLGAGVYYVIVDGLGGTVGKTAITVTAEPGLAEGDSCDNAIPVTLETGVPKSLSLDTTGFLNDTVGQCTTSNSNDVVYALTFTGTKDLLITATNKDGKYKPYFYVRTRCEDKTSEIGCAYNSAATPGDARLWLSWLPGGTYYLIVDTYIANSVGVFDVQVTATDPLPAPDNDRCEGARPLVFGSATEVSVQGDTTHAHDDYGCSTSTTPFNGNDVVYSFTLNEDVLLEVELTREAGLNWRNAFSIRSSCEPVPQDEVLCTLNGSSSATTLKGSYPMQAGSYYLVVDGGFNFAGPHTLTLRKLALPAGDACFNALPLTVGETVSGDTNGSSNGDKPACYTGSNQGDLVYYFDLDGEKNVEVEAVPPAGSTWRGIVSLRRTCEDPATDLACKYTTSVSTLSLSANMLERGRYFVLVDTYGANASFHGTFNLTVRAFDPTPVANDACPGEALVFDAQNSVTVNGETTFAHDSGTGTCAAAGSRDVVYRFSTTSTWKLTATAVRESSPPGYEPVVYLRRTCDSAEAVEEQTCATHVSGTATAVVNALPPGEWYLWVDGLGTTAGKFKLTVSLAPPVTGPENESCAAPEKVSFTDGAAQVSGTTELARDEAAGSCSDAGSADVVYHFTLSEARGLAMWLLPLPSTFQPVVVLRRSCGSRLASDEMLCAVASAPGAAVRLEADYLPAGDYYLWVEGRGSMPGAFVLDLLQSEPALPPANDTCAGAVDLAPGAAVEGDTRGALDDYGSDLAASCGVGTVLAGPDVVYRYTAATTGFFRVTLKPAESWDAVLWVTSSACGGGQTGCAAGSAGAGGDGETEEVVLFGVEGVTYFIVVDAAARGDAGPFSIVLTTN